MDIFRTHTKGEKQRLLKRGIRLYAGVSKHEAAAAGSAGSVGYRALAMRALHKNWAMTVRLVAGGGHHQTVFAGQP
jgi:hypothetical protein